jgi:hypothetical protein
MFDQRVRGAAALLVLASGMEARAAQALWQVDATVSGLTAEKVDMAGRVTSATATGQLGRLRNGQALHLDVTVDLDANLATAVDMASLDGSLAYHLYPPSPSAQLLTFQGARAYFGTTVSTTQDFGSAPVDAIQAIQLGVYVPAWEGTSGQHTFAELFQAMTASGAQSVVTLASTTFSGPIIYARTGEVQFAVGAVNVSTSAVPEPSTLPQMALGLVALVLGCWAPRRAMRAAPAYRSDQINGQ